MRSLDLSGMRGVNVDGAGNIVAFDGHALGVVARQHRFIIGELAGELA